MNSKLKKKLKNKEYRDARIGACIRHGLAIQIRSIRESRGWTQQELADKLV